MSIIIDIPPVDRSRAGILTIAPEMIGILLNLPRDHEIVAARVTERGDIDLLVEGADMPSCPEGSEAPPVTLVCTATDAGAGRHCWNCGVSYTRLFEQSDDDRREVYVPAECLAELTDEDFLPRQMVAGDIGEWAAPTRQVVTSIVISALDAPAFIASLNAAAPQIREIVRRSHAGCHIAVDISPSRDPADWRLPPVP